MFQIFWNSGCIIMDARFDFRSKLKCYLMNSYMIGWYYDKKNHVNWPAQKKAHTSEPKHIFSEQTDIVRQCYWLELLSWEEQLLGSFTVPGPLYVLEFCSQPGTALLFLLQPSAQRPHLLLSLHLYVISHDHSCLQVSLETPPFLCLVLKHTHTQNWLHMPLHAFYSQFD